MLFVICSSDYVPYVNWTIKYRTRFLQWKVIGTPALSNSLSTENDMELHKSATYLCLVHTYLRHILKYIQLVIDGKPNHLAYDQFSILFICVWDLIRLATSTNREHKNCWLQQLLSRKNTLNIVKILAYSAAHEPNARNARDSFVIKMPLLIRSFNHDCSFIFRLAYAEAK